MLQCSPQELVPVAWGGFGICGGAKLELGLLFLGCVRLYLQKTLHHGWGGRAPQPELASRSLCVGGGEAVCQPWKRHPLSARKWGRVVFLGMWGYTQLFLYHW